MCYLFSYLMLNLPTFSGTLSEILRFRTQEGQGRVMKWLILLAYVRGVLVLHQSNACMLL